MQEYEKIIVNKIVERKDSFQDILSTCNTLEKTIAEVRRFVKEEVTRCHQFEATVNIISIDIGGKDCFNTRDDLEFDKIELEIIPEDKNATNIHFEIGTYKDMSILEPIGAPYCCGQFRLNRENWLQEVYNHPYLAMYNKAVINAVDTYLEQHGYSCARCE